MQDLTTAPQARVEQLYIYFQQKFTGDHWEKKTATTFAILMWIIPTLVTDYKDNQTFTKKDIEEAVIQEKL